MALVNCPECGRENVSSTTTSCPSCGYNVQNHYNQLQQKELSKKIMMERREQITMPSKPTSEPSSVVRGFRIMNVIFFACAAIGGILTILTISNGDDATLCLIVGIGSLIAGVWSKIESTKIYREEQATKVRDYELALRNFEQYKSQKILEEDANLAYYAAEEAKRPICPVCGSKDVKRIDSIERAFSVDMLGAASAKIGKQYQCKNCSHLW